MEIIDAFGTEIRPGSTVCYGSKHGLKEGVVRKISFTEFHPATIQVRTMETYPKTVCLTKTKNIIVADGFPRT